MVRQAGRNRRPFQIAEIATAPLRTRITELELQLADRDREVERLNDFLADQHTGCNRRREELEKQVESLRKDAERWQYFREHHEEFMFDEECGEFCFTASPCWEETLDMAIDAAREEQP